MLLYKRNMFLCFYTWKLNFVFFLSDFLVNISTTIDKVVEMMFSQCRSNADEHTLTQISFSTNYWRWNNIGSSALNRRNSVNVVSTLFCKRWNNVDKHTSAQLSFSTKYQRWSNVDERWRTTSFQRWTLKINILSTLNNVDVFAGK